MKRKILGTVLLAALVCLPGNVVFGNCYLTLYGPKVICAGEQASYHAEMTGIYGGCGFSWSNATESSVGWATNTWWTCGDHIITVTPACTTCKHPIPPTTNIVTHVIRVDIAESNVVDCIEAGSRTFHLTNSCCEVYWSLSPSNYPGGPYLSGGGCQATVHFGTNCGQYTVFAMSSDTNVSCYPGSLCCDSATLNVVKVGLAANKIWWFNGENPGGCYSLTTTTSACGTPSDAILVWEVVSGADKVDLIYGTNVGNTITGTNVTSVTVTSTAPSVAVGDVAIRLTVNGTQTCTTNLTVFKPDHLNHVSDTDSEYGNTFLSVILYQILDQFANVLPGECEVPVNEDVDGNGAFSSWETVSAAAESDWTKEKGKPEDENWGWGWEGGGSVSPTNFFDQIVRLNPPCTVPTPQNPQGGSDKIDHSPQGGLYVGSTNIAKGVKVKSLKWQIYRDHGRHE